MDNKQYICTNLRNRKKSEITTSFVFHSVSMPEQMIFYIYLQCKYILFILEEEFQDYKGQSESVTQRRADNAMNKSNANPTKQPILNSGAPEWWENMC